MATSERQATSSAWEFDDKELDVWSGLDHKRGLTGRTRIPGSMVLPTWVDVGSNARRLAAYKILQSYFRNVARRFLNTDNEDIKADHREYGDPATLVKAVLAALIGEEQRIAVAGTSDEADTASQARQDWFDDWAVKERFRAKLLETERNAAKLGDGVYVLGADTQRKRVRLRLYEPGFYFPVLDPNAPEDEYPTTVHLAWEYEEPVNSGTFWVRRLTFHLGRIMPQRDIDGMPLLNDTQDGPLLVTGDQLDLERGTITRKYPWNEERSDLTCYMTDGIWRLEDLDAEGINVENFPLSLADRFLTTGDGVLIRELDLMHDFVPVVHIPNTVEILEHFGEAVVTAVAQIFDDLAAGDTDAAKAAALAGVPAVALSGIGVEALKIKPGAIFNLGMEGKMTVIDLSAALTAVMGYNDSLKKRASENARVPEEWLGRVSAADVPSGFALLMGFSPLRALIGEMRLVRDEKYPLLLKMKQRLAWLHGWLPNPDAGVIDAAVQFGGFMPTNEQELIDKVVKLYDKHLISRSTAIRMLFDGGVIDVDIADELEACESEDFEAALAFLDATNPTGGDIDGVYDMLHRAKPADLGPAPDAVPPVATGVPPVSGVPPVPGVPPVTGR